MAVFKKIPIYDRIQYLNQKIVDRSYHYSLGTIPGIYWSNKQFYNIQIHSTSVLSILLSYVSEIFFKYNKLNILWLVYEEVIFAKN